MTPYPKPRARRSGLPRPARGTRAVLRFGIHDWRVVCATCRAPLGHAHPIALQAHLAATDDSATPCPYCRPLL